MFPSTYSYSGTYPCFPSSSSSYPLFPFLNPENASASNTNTLLHDPLSVPYIIPPAHNAPIPETLTNLAVTDHNCGGGGGGAAAMPPKQDPSGGGAPHYGISCLLTKKPAKKDRHSKIYTSQGLRDRRVRLSIGIARKFFDLQDMLGFDKASNTLEWLFAKSKKAIKELARSKHSTSDGAKSFSSSSECEDCEVVSEIKQQVVTTDAPNLQGLDSNAAKERKLKRAQKEPAACVRAKMKESREKARARARERTSNKMCNSTTTGSGGRVQDLKKKCPATENPQILQHQLRSPVQPDHQDCSRSPNKLVLHPHPHPHPPHFVVGSEAPSDNFNVIEESIVIKRKLKPSLMSSHHHHHNHHQNLVIPKETGFNNISSTDYHSSFPNLSPNWDANNGAAAGRSSFCAIASMNLSAGLQIFGKSWEECTNPRLH